MFNGTGAVVPPPGKAKPDWEILDLLAARLGTSAAYDTLVKIRAEIRRLVPAYAELNGSKTAWIRPTSPMAVFGAGDAHEMISFSAVVSTADEAEDRDFPITAIFGSLRYHLGSGTRTGASERIQNVDPVGNAIISMADAEELKLKDGDSVKIETRWGEIKLKIDCSNRIAAGQLFVPLAVNTNDVTNLIDLTDLADPNTNGWKTCAVKISRA